ncbi:MAG: hypothetical protein JO086_04975 [Acidimicrobiia bacterium]|nr:hypothetical protein [Acidimicrobiia bacterium]
MHEEDPDSIQAASVVAHGLLTSMSVISASIRTLRDHWDDLSPDVRSSLFERVVAHDGIVAEGLRDLARGVPDEALAGIETKIRRRRRDA